MNIAYLCNEYPPRRHGGIGTSVQHLARHVAAGGHRVWVLGWSAEPESWRDGAVEVELIPATSIPKAGWWINRRRCAQRLWQIDRAHDLDLVESPDWDGLAAWQRFPCPLIVRLNGSDTYFSELLDRPVRRLTRRTEADTLRRADRIASVSAFCWETTQRVFGLDGEAAIIPNSVDCQMFRPDSSTAPEPESILYVGTVDRKKGIFPLLRAFQIVAAERPDATLKIAGRDNPDRESHGESTFAAALATVEHDVTDRVRYLGVVPYAQAPALLRSAHVCCLPSYAEALPMTWIEAMASGAALVASNRGPGPEVAEHRHEALLVDPDDEEALAAALLEVLTQPALASRLGEAARQRCLRSFDTSVILERNLSWYEEVIAANERRRC